MTTPESNAADRRSKTVPILVLAVFLVLAAAVGLYYGLRSRPTEAPPVATAPAPAVLPASGALPLAVTVSTAPMEARVGQAVIITATVSGRGTDSLSFAGDGLPDGAAVKTTGPDTAQVVWTPRSGQEGTHRFGIVVSAGDREARGEVTLAVAPQALETVTNTAAEAVHFAFDRSDVIAAEQDRLRILVDSWRDYTEISAVFLTGHTDHTGADAYNQALGLRRANAVQSVLVDLGIPADRITVASSGETSPIATNATREGRARNRRCAVTVEARRAVSP